ncbi:hypothetical protein [Candidatus Mycoplasma haematominutum]|uniref:ATP synthase F1, epsilon subunit n=1 Tax=Candidatus Mycoplasma haematominutum 'Birmingham 1' TaxID=1116213 RepID=G8C383_9MOLU|nr:hypothetical protein [Candidatus Mycoplasma haematominutum]CCE66781.1 ATP synthase F1, epsilon subunit [Candidatus Mycoplasma haematominutum 'Birmingham 1']
MISEPKHQRLRVNRLTSPNEPLRVRIIGPTKIFATEDVEFVKLNLFDGLMQINKRYAAVIEKLKGGEIRLKLASPSVAGKAEKKYSVSPGWVIVAHNLCEILVKHCEEIT